MNRLTLQHGSIRSHSTSFRFFLTHWKDRGPDLHRASDQVFDALCFMEGTPADWCALRPIYQAESAARARERLEDFDHGPWGQKYPAIAQSWRRNWEQVIPFFAFAPDLRKILYTTNAIESLNAQVRKAVRVRGHFPSEEAAAKLIWLVLRNVQARWKNPPITWQAAKTQMAIQFEDRFILAE
jgi:putative transposase